MKIGCQMAFNDRTSPDFIAAAAGIAEERGFESLWVPEHVVFFQDYDSRYPYTDNGRIQGDPRSLLDPFSALTYVAANTSRIRLGTGICLVPQRNPVYTARQVADLDFLSNGRFDFGIGIGWLKEEFEALGVPWENRAGRTNECIEVMQALWCNELSAHDGERFKFEGVYQNPKPVQQPHPPLIFGGESNAALRRVATVGQGWYGFNLTPALLEERLKILEPMLQEAGRSLADIRIVTTPGREATNPDDIRIMGEMGVEQIILGLFAGNEVKLKERADKVLSLVA